jgi:pimeloyl-ACP methyl ester carboxylesterase
MRKEIYFRETKLAEESIYDGEGRFVDIDGLRTYVIDKGRGKDIIFINGIAVSCFTWRKLLNIMDNKFRTIAFDFKGTGLSEKRGNNSVEAYTSQLLSIMEKFNISEAILVGNSLGGEIALDITIKHPERVGALVLIDAAGYNKGKKVMRLLVRSGRLTIIYRMLRLFLSRIFTKKMIQWAVFNEKIITDQMVEGYYRPAKTKGAVGAFINLVRNLSYTEFDSSKIPEIKKPTLIIWGEEDRIIKVEDAYLFKRHIENSRLHIIKRCGHAPQEEYPEKVAELITAFINDVL